MTTTDHTLAILLATCGLAAIAFATLLLHALSERLLAEAQAHALATIDITEQPTDPLIAPVRASAPNLAAQDDGALS